MEKSKQQTHVDLCTAAACYFVFRRLAVLAQRCCADALRLYVPYQNEIVTYARRNDIDPFLVAAVIKNESEFKPGAVSPVGAIGMMQIMPETGEWIAKQMGLNRYDVDSLYNPGVNIRMGCWYLSELKYEFKDNLLLMMMAYNAGRGNTHGWMNANGWDYTFGDVKQIPYPESRNYVASVLYDRDEYYRLYKDKVEKRK